MQTTPRHRPLFALRRIGCCLSLLLAGPGSAQTLFTETTVVSAVPTRFISRSSAFGDYNNDDRPDMFLTENYGDRRVLLLYNEGDGRFSDRTDLIQEYIPSNHKGGGSIFGDYDNDGDLDLFTTLTGSEPRLYENLGGDAQSWLRVQAGTAPATTSMKTTEVVGSPT